MADAWDDDWVTSTSKSQSKQYEVEDQSSNGTVYKPQLKVLKRQDEKKQGETIASKSPEQIEQEKKIKAEEYQEFSNWAHSQLELVQASVPDTLAKTLQDPKASLAIGAAAISSIIMFRKLFGGSSKAPPSSVIVQVGKNSSYRLEFSEADAADPKLGVSVGFVRDKIIDLLKSKDKAVETVSLIHAGKKLTNDKATLLDYGVTTDSKILVTIRRPQAPAQPAPTPRTPRQKIQDALDSVKNELETPIHKFIASPPKDAAEREDHHRRLSEMVLQRMFALDDVDVGEDKDLRTFRKEAINKFHTHHANLDKAKKEADENSLKPASSNASKSSRSSKKSKKSKNKN